MNWTGFESLVADPLLRAEVALVYDEETFRHFLSLERKRAEYSSRSFLLLLVSLPNRPKTGDRVSPSVASAIFEGFRLCVREVDFVGWYEEGRVAGAVLAQGANPPEEALRRVADRVTSILRGCFSKGVAESLQVRVIRVGGDVQN